MKSYDVVIAGGGPAGLLLAGELSKDQKYSVLVLEKNRERVGKTKYGWSTWAPLAGEFEDCILGRNKKYGFDVYGSTGPMVANAGSCGGIATIDDAKFLNKYAELAKKNGAEFVEGTLYTDFSRDDEKEGVVVHTHAGEDYRAKKLFIDATGVNSPTVKKHRLINPHRQRYWRVYGGILEDAPVEDVDRADILKTFYESHPLELFEVFPIDKRRALTWILTLDKGKPGSIKQLKEKYARIKDEYLGWKESRLVEEKHGIIPLVELKAHAFDNVLLVGDAGGWTPPFCGMGFSAILSNYRRVASEIKERLEDGKLDQKSPGKIDVSEREGWNRDLQHLIISTFCRASPKDVADSFELFKKRNVAELTEAHLTSNLSRETMKQFVVNGMTELGPRDILKQVYRTFRHLPLREYPSAIRKALECAMLP